MTQRTALSFDIGGTKIAAAIIDQQGHIIERIQNSTVTDSGPNQLISDVVDTGKALVRKHPVDCIGISSAGPLDPLGGYLINPTNMKTNQYSWGNVPLSGPIEEAFAVPTILENDAAAAVVGESWKGRNANAKSILILTLGTGVGVGALVDGRLQRNRRGFHPEVSHISLNPFDTSALCGCGNLGCIEAYLSGVNFPNWYSRTHGVKPLSGKSFVQEAHRGNPQILTAFEKYAELMAQALNSLILIYSPEHVVFSGSFSAALPFFKDKTFELLKQLLKDRREGLDYLPSLERSQIPDDAGLLGAAKMAFLAPERF